MLDWIARYSLLSILMVALHGLAEGQVASRDSLRNVLDDPLTVESRVQVLNELAWQYRDIRADSALYFANQAVGMAKQNNLRADEVKAINYMGVAYRNLGVYSRAFEKYLEALKLAEEYEIHDQRGYALINLGNLYLFQTNFQGAIRYFIQALDQAQTLGNRRMQGYCFINLGRSYEGIAEYGQAELYINQAIEIRKKQNDQYGVIAAEIELADIYRKSGEIRKARRKVDEILTLIKGTENPRVRILAYNSLSKIYLQQGMSDKAKYYSDEALRLSKQVASRYDERNTLEQISDIYLVERDFENAYETYLQYAELNQQLFSEENIRRIEQLKNQYEIEQQETENKFLREQAKLKTESISRLKTIIGLSVAGLLLLAGIIAFVIRAYIIRKRLSEEIEKQKNEIEKDKSTIEKQSKKLQQLDKAKSRFFANVSHDLRSPLSLIIGNLEMIAEDEDSFMSPRSRKHLEISVKNSRRLLYLTDEINDITRLEEGKISLKKENVRLHSFLKMLIEMFQGTAEQKGISLTLISKIEDSDQLLIDPRQFEKIFYNLISNAIRHCLKGDTIDVVIQRDNKNALIFVRDSGSGIDENSLPHIFDRFFQSADNDYQTREGLGIGLALVRDLVELHGGSISVSSKLRQGTEFRLLIPGLKAGRSSDNIDMQEIDNITRNRHDLLRELNTTVRNVTIPTQQAQQKRVLIVEDHPEIRYYIRQILEDKFIVGEASHGIEALEILKEDTVDIILTDLMMPWMDGFELIEAINDNPEYRKIPLLVVSARISGDDKEKVLYKGINDYLQKPFSKKELVLRIENLLQQKEKYTETAPSVFASLVKDNLIEVEKDLLKKLESEVKERISDPGLSVLSLTEALAASERQVYRLVKKLTGMTPNEYIKEVRLQYVDYLIRKNKVRNATEAAKSIGLKNVTQFSRQYEKRFGVKPAELLQS